MAVTDHVKTHVIIVSGATRVHVKILKALNYHKTVTVVRKLIYVQSRMVDVLIHVTVQLVNDFSMDICMTI